MASCPGFDATLAATASRRYVAAGPIDAPITVAFGSRDLLLLRRSRYLDELPSHAHLAALRHCGHIPMYDNPRAVAALIIATAVSIAAG